MIANPLNILEYTRAHLIEEIMRLAGCEQENPRRYRSQLETCSIESLTETRNRLTATWGDSQLESGSDAYN